MSDIITPTIVEVVEYITVQVVEAPPGPPGATTIEGIEGLDGALTTLAVDLTTKSSVGHEHPISEIQGLQVALDSKAGVDVVASKSDVGHMHAIADTVGLQAALDLRSEIGHTHSNAEVNAAISVGASLTRAALGAGAVGGELFLASTVAAALHVLGFQPLSPSADMSVVNSATPANISGMSFVVAADTSYAVLLIANIDAGGNGYDMRLNVPSLYNGAVNQNGYGFRMPGSGSISGVNTITTTNLRVAARGATQVGPEVSFFAFTTGGSSGIANFQFCQFFASAASVATLRSKTKAFIIKL